MHLVEIIRRPDTAELATTTAFVDRITDALGARPLSDHLWLDLQAGGSDGFHLIRIHDESGQLAIAQISAANDASSLEVVVDPTLDPDRRRHVHDDAATTAIDAFRRAGGGRLFWWLDDPDEDLLDLASRAGLEPVRSLHEMRRPLPLDRRADVATRSFRPGIDDDEWVRVNNRAFAGHGEQGGWTTATLALRLAEPWFDPEGFRIHERDGRIAAFCWTKLHDELDPVVGEIYVIAVDPDFHGTGLGTQLTLAGLDSIADRGVTVANLYVDADNTAAVALYDRLGFTIHRTRTACAGDLHPTPTETP
jgi:mycothiol synthase